MSKEYIQALERIKTKIIIETEIRVNKELCVANPYYNDYLIVQQALQRLETIDNAEPDKALECLERIDNTLCLNNNKGKLEFGIDTEEHTDCDSVIGMTEDIENIKQALIQAEQDKKKAICWDIVVKKNVDVSLIKKYDFVEDYNSAVWIAGRPKLVKEEFTTLKEGLK